MLRFQLTVRAGFDRLVDTRPDTLADLERAARFLYLQRTAFGGKVSGRNFGVAAGRPGRFSLTTPEPAPEDLHSRLAGVLIEGLDFAEFIRRYHAPGTPFYLDPPYWGHEDDYGRALFSRDRFDDLAAVLRALKGRFILSPDDVEGVRETFDGFRFEALRTTCTIGAGAAQTGRAEVLIANRPLPGVQ